MSRAEFAVVFQIVRSLNIVHSVLGGKLKVYGDFFLTEKEIQIPHVTLRVMR